MFLDSNPFGVWAWVEPDTHSQKNPTSGPRGVSPKHPEVIPKTQRVQVPNNKVLGFWVIVTIVQVLGKYMIIRYLDSSGNLTWRVMGT